MVHHVIETTACLNPTQLVLVASPYLTPALLQAPVPVTHVVQQEPKGTGDAVRVALEALAPQITDVLIVCGDTPLLTHTTLQTLLDKKKTVAPEDTVLLGMQLDDPKAYGRLILNDASQTIQKIIETKDATPEQRKIQLCNAGVYLCARLSLQKALRHLDNQNQAQEYYLTDIVEHSSDILTHLVLTNTPEELEGVNNLEDLAQAEAALQQRWRQEKMGAGVTLYDPHTVYFSSDTKVAPDVTIYPHVFIGPGVEIAEGAVIYPGCMIEHTRIGPNAKVGPYARLRGGCVLETGAEVGNFVEVKNAQFAPYAKAKHLSYLGDVSIGSDANIGAGTITCNYNGFSKFSTTIGAGAFIGSHTALIAPVAVGEHAIVAAGSVITDDVPAGDLGIARARQNNKEKWAVTFRSRYQLLKN